MKVILLIVLALAGGVTPGAIAWAATAGDNNSPPLSPGEQLYRQHCAVCHGDRGDGRSRARSGLNPPPRDFTAAQAREELSRERMITSVTHGRPGTAMVGWGARLSPQQIAEVVEYVRANLMQLHQDDLPSQPVAIEEASLGRQIFMRHCAVCHGDQGSGAVWTHNSLNPAPRDFTAPEARTELSRERMITSVTYGRPGTAMMPFTTRLSSVEIAAVVDYVREAFINAEGATSEAQMNQRGVPGGGHNHGHTRLGMGATSAPQGPAASTMGRRQIADADMSLPFPNSLQGDGGQGRDFYMANCFNCHGKQGDGRGPRSKFIRPKPRNFLHPDARRVLNRPNLFKAISTGIPGTVMPAWQTVLSEQEIANVAEFVFGAFILGEADDTALPGSQPDDELVSPGAKKKVTTP